jgi:DNA repair protein RadC
MRVKEDRAIFRALRIVEQRAAERGPKLNDPHEAARYFRLRLGNEEREHFEVAFLDAGHRLIACERLFSGGLDAAEVQPRIVVQRALALNAGAVIVAHNHPSGNPAPSDSDRALTARLKHVLSLVDVRLLDHVVIAAREATSMAERRML